MPKPKRKARSDPAPSSPPNRQPSLPPPNLGKLAWPRDALLAAGLALMIAVAYWPVARNDFTNYDDDDYVVENEFVNQGLSANNLVWAFVSLDRANWHPLTWISHMLDCQLFGLHPAGHHLVSLGLHAMNSILLYCVLLRMTRAVWPSAVVAAFFAVHPLHVESVAWVAERKDVLSTLFGLIALGAWLRYLARPGLLRYVAVMFWFAASLMSKPMWVTFPFLLLILDFWPLGRFLLPGGTIVFQPVQTTLNPLADQGTIVPPGRRNLRFVMEKLPLLLMSVASCIVTYYAQSRGMAVASMKPGDRLAAVTEGYCGYLWKMAVPLNLAPIYPMPKTFDYLIAIACAAALALCTALVVWAARKRKYVAVGWFWYLGTLVPVIGIIHVGYQAIADRYTYLPSVGIFILVAWSASDLVARWPWLRPALAALTAAALAACCLLTSAQVRLWASTETLFTHTAAVTQDNAVALTNLGLVAIHKEDYAEAQRRLDEALQIEPTQTDAMGNLATMYVKQKKYDEAIKKYNLMLRLGLSPDKAGKACVQLANVYATQGNLAGKEFCLRAAAQLEPSSAGLHNDLALTQQTLGKSREALENYAIALRLKPGENGTLNNMAWIYAAHPDDQIRNGAKAVELMQSLAAKPDCDSNLLDTLAAAYAEKGRFDEAVKTIELAINRARGEEKSSETILDMEKRAALYKKGQPYRDTALLGPPNSVPPKESGNKK